MESDASNIDKAASDSELNGDKLKSNDDLTMDVESEDSTAVEASSEDNENVTPSVDKEESEVSEESKEDVDSSKRSRKRKVSESTVEDQASNVIEDEAQEKAQDEKVENMMLSPGLEGLGKGKRARIPNKRYSDIALSPLSKVQKHVVENGEKEKTAPSILERVEFKTGSDSPTSSKRQQKVIIDPSDPNFLKPFKYGWKRELVWRSSGSESKTLGDIYYYSPQGKKLRSMREISEHITDRELTVNDFTFIKVPLKADSDKQIIRDAKVKSAGSNSTTKNTSTVAKTKKIASPKPETPASSSNIEVETVAVATEVVKNSRSSRRSTKITNVTSSDETVAEVAPAPVTPATPKPKVTRNKSEKKNATPKVETPSEAVTVNEDGATGKKPTRKSGRWSQKATIDAAPKAPTVSRRKTIKLDKITNQNNDKSNVETIFMENYLQNLSHGYNTLLYVFQYLKVQDLLRAGCVCTMWRDIANHPILWSTVRMKNSQVRSFEGLANALRKHGTVRLDLRKMLLTNNDEIWTEFSENIGKVETLRKIELCRCPASVVEKLTETNPDLEVVNAVTIRCEEMDCSGLSNWKNLKELRFKSTNGLKLMNGDLDSLSCLKQIKCLSLTSIKDLHLMKLEVIAELTDLECLDLGECTNFPENFGKNILGKLMKLEKLRLEKGQGDCHTFKLLDAVKEMKQLDQLELVNFDIKAGFDKALGACKNIKKLLIIPTYISQSATTNHMVLGGVLRLQKSLSHFVWGVTLELLRVTELFVDQCEKPEKKDVKKNLGNGDSIPVLKPVPLISDDLCEIPPALDPPQVEILALPGLQKLLLQSLPTTRVKILKIPFHATWRQTITDAVN